MLRNVGRAISADKARPWTILNAINAINAVVTATPVRLAVVQIRCAAVPHSLVEVRYGAAIGMEILRERA